MGDIRGNYILVELLNNKSNSSQDISNDKIPFFGCYKINTLITKKLIKALDIIVEFDENCYIAKPIDFPLYSCGDSVYEAIQNLKKEIENLHFELKEDDNFSDEWLNYKKFFNEVISDL